MRNVSDYPGWVNTKLANDNALFDPSRISNVRLVGIDYNGERCLQSYEFDYETDLGQEVTHVAIVPVQRGESFQDEVDRALAEREDPAWRDPRLKVAV